MSQVTRWGTAVVTTVTPPAEADADTARHSAWPNHMNVVRFTNCSRSAGGLIAIIGGGIGVYPNACCANADVLGAAGPLPHTTIPERMPLASTQSLRYQAPSPEPFAGPNPCAAASSAK